MKTMRFTTLALLVAGAFAANEQCDDRDGLGGGAVVCAAGYDNNGSSTAIATEVLAGDAVNPAVVGSDVSTACCAAKTGDFAGDAASDVNSATTLTFAATATTVTCNAGYQVANANADGFQATYTVALADDGTATTFVPATASAGCAAKTGDFAGDAKSDVNASTTLTFDATATTVTCNDGYQVANAAADGFQATYTVALADDGTAATFVPATASAGCAAKTYAIGAVFTVEGTVAVAIPNSNFAVLTTTATYDQGGLTFACDTGYTKVSTVTATFATETFTNGNGKLTVADTAAAPTAADKICVKDAPAPAPASAPAAGSAGSAGSVADSATDSSASPAALAAAGMAAIALLL